MSLITDQVMSKLKPEEQEAVRMILKEYSNTGKSDLLQKLYDEDYDEIPVDIDTFIESPEYAGWFTNNGKGVYPYWRDKLREMYNEDKNYSEIAVTGGIGTGKTHIAVLALSYGLYRVMCLKDPVRFYRLNGDILYVVFFNATLQLSRGVAYSKFQELLQHSPWFMARGKVTGTKYLEYTPNGPIRFTVGSQYEHSLGRAVILGLMDEVNFCLYKDTRIYTNKGIKTLEELQNTDFKVYYLDTDNQVKLSDFVTAKVTDYVSELYEIELEDGTVIKCSGTHLFMLEDGTYKQARELTEEDQIKSFGEGVVL